MNEDQVDPKVDAARREFYAAAKTYVATYEQVGYAENGEEIAGLVIDEREAERTAMVLTMAIDGPEIGARKYGKPVSAVAVTTEALAAIKTDLEHVAKQLNKIKVFNEGTEPGKPGGYRPRNHVRALRGGRDAEREYLTATLPATGQDEFCDLLGEAYDAAVFTIEDMTRLTYAYAEANGIPAAALIEQIGK